MYRCVRGSCGTKEQTNICKGELTKKKKKEKKKGKETQLEKENSPNILLRKWGTCRYG